MPAGYTAVNMRPAEAKALRSAARFLAAELDENVTLGRAVMILDRLARMHFSTIPEAAAELHRTEVDS